MSIRVMSAVWELDLPDSEKLVALALADWCNDQGECWPSIPQIAKKCSKSERTVQNVTASLETKGHLTRHMIPGRGCKYHLHPRKDCTTTPAAAAPATPRSRCTPAKSAPVQGTTDTPAAAAPNTSSNHQSKNTQSVREHEIPDDWSPREFGKGTKSRETVDGWPPGELESQVEHFTAHHRGKGSKFKDWQDAWSTWVLNSRRFGGPNHGNHRQSSSQRDRGRVDGFTTALRKVANSETDYPFAGNG